MEDLDGIRSDLKNEVKNEIIMLLGAALGAGTVRVVEGATGRGNDSTAMKAAEDTKETEDPTMMELVDNWG